MSLPILFIHTGKSYYLKYSISQARSSNPESLIYLLGDEANSRLLFANHNNINIFSLNANRFEKIYKHLSHHSYEFELFCFKRWFVLEEFIDQHGIDSSFIYLDSDVMLYENLERLSMFLGQFDFTVTGERGPQYLYFKNSEVLRAFTAFITEMYSDQRSVRELEDTYHQYCCSRSFAGGGVCDMTLLEKFKNESSYKSYDLNKIVNDSVFDNSICSSERYQMNPKLNIKKLFWYERKPFGFHLDLRKLIKFNAVHFQGEGKKYIPYYYRGNQIFPQALIENYLLLNLAQRIKRKIKECSGNRNK